MPSRLPCPSSRRLLTASNRTRTPTSSTTSPPSWLASSPPTNPARRHYAAASSIAAAFRLPDNYVPPTKPPSARPVETRKSQLLRSYTSLLRSTPLMLIFQQNNASSMEWAAMRRELKFALEAVAPKSQDPDAPAAAAPDPIAPYIQLQVVRTSMFRQALKVLEFWDPAAANTPGTKNEYTHDLSMAAYQAVKAAEAKPILTDSMYAQLAPLLVGPLALLTFPAVSPAHLAAALSILAPSPPAFPAPTRRKNPGYHDAITQGGLQKLMLIGGRIEGKAFDMDGVRWVGGIEGGLDGLRAQLVGMLQGAGLGLTSALEGAGKSLWVTLESRRVMLKDEGKAPEEKKEE
ncbi:unnamed protein product [Discula destructiva]